jgi:hypothetical protein
MNVKVTYVNASNGNSRVDDDTLRTAKLNAHLLLGNLLCDEGRNIWLERSGSETHDNQSENKNTKRSIRVLDDGGSSGGDENQMTDLSNEHRVQDSLVTTEVSISDPGSEKRADIDPKGVECGQREGNLLAHSESTCDGFFIARVEGRSGGSLEWLCDEVGVDSDGSVVAHTLDQLNESDLWIRSARVSYVSSAWRLDTYGKDLERDLSGHAPEGRKVLISGEVIAIDVAVLESSLAFGVHVGGRRGGVEFRVLSGRVARGINQGWVQADSLLRGRSAVFHAFQIAVILTTSPASPIGIVGERGW